MPRLRSLRAHYFLSLAHATWQDQRKHGHTYHQEILFAVLEAPQDLTRIPGRFGCLLQSMSEWKHE